MYVRCKLTYNTAQQTDTIHLALKQMSLVFLTLISGVIYGGPG